MGLFRDNLFLTFSEAVMSSWEVRVMSQHSLVVISYWGMLPASSEAKDVAKTPYDVLDNPTIKNYPTQKVDCTEVERPCSKQWFLIRVQEF